MKLKDRLHEYKIAVLYYIFRVFPIEKRKVVFCNYNGKGYGCNPKYIAEEMIRRGSWELVWLVSDIENTLPKCIKKVKYNSVSAVYELATAGVWIDNQRKLWYHRKRRKQYFLETWHGAGIPMKKIGADNPQNIGNRPYEHTSLHMNKIVNLMICNSKACTEIFRRAFLYTGEILECGYPRNDILVTDNSLIKKKVYKYLGLEDDIQILLYAPTYRKGRNTNMYQLEPARLISVLEETFGGKWVVLFRLHPTMRQKAEELSQNNKKVVNVSYYDDVQELLAASTILVSDYSSVISEFSITGKPVFLYAEDVKDYAQERDFYTDYYSLPFPIAETNEELIENIQKYDENIYQKKVWKYLEKVGMKEYGTASAKVVDILEQAVKK